MASHSHALNGVQQPTKHFTLQFFYINTNPCTLILTLKTFKSLLHTRNSGISTVIDMAALKMVSVLVLCMLVAAPMATQAITCGQVASSLAPCINYLKGPGGQAPPAACCNGVKAINNAAKTTPDRQTACNCLKSAARGVSGLNPSTAESLPSKCGVSIPYKISLSTNCAT